MAKHVTIKGLTARQRARRAARLALTQTVDRTFASLPAALAGEAEAGIHEMRVACKQLREQMRLFRPIYRHRLFDAAIDRVDRLNDTLGIVRDDDVMIEHIDDLLPGADGLPGDWREALLAERAGHHATLAPLLQELLDEDYASRLRTTIIVGRRERDHPDAGGSTLRFARLAIGRRMAKVGQRMAAVDSLQDAARLHRVRVANKQLRYAIEPFLGIFGRRLKMAYSRVAELHTTLGDLHDLDVMAQRLTEFADHLDRSAEAAPALARIADRRAREQGRVLTFFGDGAADNYLQLIADAID